MKDNQTIAMTISEVIEFLKALPNQEEIIPAIFVEDKSFTVYVDSKGNAKTLRNSLGSRVLILELPIVH